MSEPTNAAQLHVDVETLRLALQDVIDPELGYNIVDLGLVYDVAVSGTRATITMTMTTPGCPAAETIENGVRQRADMLPGLEATEVTIVWDPPWSPSMMSEDAKRHFGFH